MKKYQLISIVLIVIAGLQVTATSLRPTVYYISTIALDQQTCGHKKTIYSTKGEALYKICGDDYQKCVIEGTCAVIKKMPSLSKTLDILADIDSLVASDEIFIINYIDTKNGVPVFNKVDKSKCPYGFGVKNICLDPYYTIAADLNYYNAGDVIFVDAVKGTKLPSGEVHDGFFIVRDRGGAIKGANRFDFYTGLIHYKHDLNPFTPLGLANENRLVTYRKATASEAIAVKRARNYPKLPLD